MDGSLWKIETKRSCGFLLSDSRKLSQSLLTAAMGHWKYGGRGFLKEREEVVIKNSEGGLYLKIWRGKGAGNGAKWLNIGNEVILKEWWR